MTRTIARPSRLGRRGLVLAAVATISVAAVGVEGSVSDAGATQAAAPANTLPPTISGQPQVGRTLTATSGSWSGDAPIAFVYRWRRCDSGGADCDDISGATNPTYTVPSSDRGRTLRISVTATNDDGSAQALSGATAVVTRGERPVNTARPVVAGTLRERETLTAVPGSWSNEPTSFTFQWQRCNDRGFSCRNIGGATRSSYALVGDDVGHRLRISIVARNAHGWEDAQSEPTGVVAPLGFPPANTARPTIGGTPREGQTLSAGAGSWTNSPTSYSVQWRRCNDQGSGCGNISGATKSSYGVVRADVGRRLRVFVVARNAFGAAGAHSEPTGVVAPVVSQPANTARPSVSGTLEVGRTLTANPGSWTNNPSFAYQWQRCAANGSDCANIPAATAATYVATSADVGRRLRISVVALNAAGSASAQSEPTSAVQEPGVVRLPGGVTSVPITSVSLPQRLIIDQVSFSPNPVRSRLDPLTIRVRVVDTRGFLVRDALVFVRSTPLLTTTPAEQPTGQDGWVTFTVQPTAGFPLRNGFNVQFFVRARKSGENVLAGVTASRLVQVRTARPG